MLQRTTATLGSTAVQIAPSSRTPAKCPSKDFKGLLDLKYSDQSHPDLLPTPIPVREPQGNSWLLAPSVPSVRPQYVGTSLQSGAIPTPAGVITRHVPVCTPRQPLSRVLQLQQTSIHRSLTPRITTALPRRMIILQPNCNGLSSKIEKIIDFMSRKGISITAVQETKLNSCTDFNVILKDREQDNGGGLAFILYNTVKYPLKTATSTAGILS